MVVCRNIFSAFIIVSITRSVNVSDDDKLLNIVIEFCSKSSWKSVSIITDYKDKETLNRRLSQVYVYSRIFGSLNGFLLRDENDAPQLPTNIIVRCNGSCLEQIPQTIFQENLFHRNFHWMLVYNNNSDFIKDSVFLSGVIRVDSEVYAIINSEDHNNNTRKIVQLQHKKSEVVHPSKTIAYVGSKVVWVHHQQFTPVLSGLNLTVSVFHSPPVVFVREHNDVITVKSIRNNLLCIFAEYLGFRIKYDALHVEGKRLNTTFADFWNIQRQKLRNKEIDMTGMFMPISLPDFVNMSHSTDIFTVRLAIVLRNVKYTPKSKNMFSVYTTPFTLQVWICIFIAVILCVSVSCLASKYQYFHLIKATSFHKIYDTVNFLIQDILTCYPSQGFNFVRSPTNSTKIIIIVSIIFTSSVITHFSSVLTASLAADNYKIPFKNLEDLIDDGRFKIGALQNSPVEFSIKQSKFGVFREIQTKAMYQGYDNMHVALRRVLHDSYYAMFCPLEYCTLLNCSYAFLKTTYLPFHVAVNFPKDSPYVEIFSRFIMRMRAAGILYRNVRSFTKSHRHECAISTDYEPVNLRQSATPFVALAVGIIMSLVLLFFEIKFI